MSQPSDASLIRRARDGDERAFEGLFERYGEILQRRIRRHLPAHLTRRVSVADILQEVRIAAHGAIAGLEDRGEGSFRNWLLTIADSKLRDAIRRHADVQRRAVGREVSRGQRRQTGQFVGNVPSPSQAAIGAEVADRIRIAMETLVFDHREVLRLVREEGLTMREAAARMGRSREAVKKLYGRALCQLKAAYARLEGGDDGPR